TYLLAVLPSAAGLLIALIGVVTLVELARRAAPWLTRNNVTWQPFAGFAMLYIAFYVTVGLRGVRLFPWYLVPIEPFYLLAAAAPKIGAIGDASNLRVLDTVGLVSPAALPYYPLPAEQLVTDNAIPARLITDRQPDVVVTLDAFAQRSLLADSTFQRDYRLEASYPTTVWQSHELLLFRRAEP